MNQELESYVEEFMENLNQYLNEKDNTTKRKGIIQRIKEILTVWEE